MASGGEDLPSTTAANLAGNSGALSAVLSAMSRDRREAGDAVTLNALRKGVEEKEAGNACLKEGDVQGAVKHYHFGHMQTKSAMCSQGGGLAQLAGMGGMQDLAEEDDEAASATKKELQNLHISLLNNLTVALMKLERWERAVQTTSDILKLQPQNSKALMRRAKAHIKLNKLLAANKDVEAGLAIAPGDADLKNMKEFLDKRNSIYDQRQATAMRGWIDRM